MQSTQTEPRRRISLKMIAISRPLASGADESTGIRKLYCPPPLFGSPWIFFSHTFFVSIPYSRPRSPEAAPAPLGRYFLSRPHSEILFLSSNAELSRGVARGQQVEETHGEAEDGGGRGISLENDGKKNT